MGTAREYGSEEQRHGSKQHAITWYQNGGNTFVQGDVNGDTTADFLIELTGTIPLSMSGSGIAQDFIL